MRIEEFLPPSPYAQSRDHGTDRLMVVFSPAGMPAGQFAGLARSDGGRYDLLSFNSPDAQWYVGGIPETASDPDRFEAGLSAFIRSGGYRRVLFYGASKGAYGAVDFGLRCGATSIVVTGLESLHGLCALFRKVVSKPVAARQRRRLGEWRALAAAGRARVHSFHGVESMTDLVYAWGAQRRLGTRALAVARAGHYLPSVIQRRAGLEAVLEEVLDRDRIGNLEKSVVDLDLGRVTRSAVACVQGAVRRRFEPGFEPGIVPGSEAEAYVVAAALTAQRRPFAALALLRRPHGETIRNGVWQMLRVRALLDAGKPEAAEPIARRLHLANPAALEPLQLLHRALLMNRRTEEAAGLAIAGYRADPRRLGLLESHLGHLVRSSRQRDAALLLDAECALDPGSARLIALAAIAARLGLAVPRAGGNR